MSFKVPESDVVLRVGSCNHDTDGTYGMSDSRWKMIKAELQKETETIFYRYGDVLLIDSVGKFDSELELTSSTGQLKIKYVPERNAVRWETEKEYGFERISLATASLVESLIRRIHKP
jgi:hypothetical protein